MAKLGRPPVLDEIKQREILAILSVGCSRRTAAKYVGCAPSTIQNTAERDEKFAEKLDRGENQAVVTHMTNINKAAKKAQYWRAAAWALERLNRQLGPNASLEQPPGSPPREPGSPVATGSFGAAKTLWLMG